MAHHIILSAFGTTTQSQHTYAKLNEGISPHFPDSRIHWFFSSPTVRDRSGPTRADKPRTLAELLQNLNTQRSDAVVVQSLHVMPGHEFHRVARETLQSDVPAAIGMPLLTTPDDYNRVADCLIPLIDAHKQEAILILGHGTSHPSWTSYPALEKVLRKKAGPRIFVTGLEQYPDSETIIDEITQSGFGNVFVIPFLMVAGMHFQRDIVGDAANSWKSKLTRENINLTVHDQGLGLLPGIENIFCDHIRTALMSLSPELSRS
jgi:sirohydrochlorin cobaltochelatase